jgi:acyl-CoA synthetase (AMP-forming)/AMP-acid ligase II
MTADVLQAGDAEARQRRLGGLLLADGLRRGDRLGLVAPDTGPSADGLCLVLAALRLGIVPVVLNPALLPAERQALLDDADVARVVTPALLAGDAAPTELAPWPLARPMLYTSGTSGTPKGVWSGVLGDDDAAALLAEERELWGFEPGDRHLVCGALYHSAPLRFAFGTLLAGGTLILAGRFDAPTAARAIAEHRPTTTFVAPVHLQRLLDLPEVPDLGSFRLLAHAGAPCPEPLKRRAFDHLPTGTVWEFYGSTEGQFTACPPEHWLERPGTVGRARPGRRLEVDETGIIWCEVPSWARFEYWRDPGKTESAWDGDNFTVNDVGRLDDDGFLFLDGRRDDLIITGGVNVYPAEVERALVTIPGVEDAVVFPRDDDTWGQRVCAAVVGQVDADKVRAAARQLLAAYKVPKEVHVVAEIPVSPTGKVQRHRLAEQLAR